MWTSEPPLVPQVRQQGGSSPKPGAYGLLADSFDTLRNREIFVDFSWIFRGIFGGPTVDYDYDLWQLWVAEKKLPGGPAEASCHAGVARKIPGGSGRILLQPGRRVQTGKKYWRGNPVGSSCTLLEFAALSYLNSDLCVRTLGGPDRTSRALGGSSGTP